MALRRAWTIRSFSVTVALSCFWVEGEKWRGPKISAGVKDVFELIEASGIRCDWTSIEQLRLNNINSRPEHGVLRRHCGKSASQYTKKYSYKKEHFKTYNPRSYKTWKYHGLLFKDVSVMNLSFRPGEEPEYRDVILGISWGESRKNITLDLFAHNSTEK